MTNRSEEDNQRAPEQRETCHTVGLEEAQRLGRVLVAAGGRWFYVIEGERD